MSSDFIAIPVKPVEYIVLDSSLKFRFRDENDAPCDEIFTREDIPFLNGILSQIREHSTRESMKKLIKMISESEDGYRLVEKWL